MRQVLLRYNQFSTSSPRVAYQLSVRAMRARALTNYTHITSSRGQYRHSCQALVVRSNSHKSPHTVSISFTHLTHLSLSLSVCLSLSLSLSPPPLFAISFPSSYCNICGSYNFFYFLTFLVVFFMNTEVA